MCVISMVMDHYNDKWKSVDWTGAFLVPDLVSKEDFTKLRADVDEMMALLKRAKLYDDATGQPDCENEQKMVLLRNIAKLVGVDLDEVFKPQGSK